MDTDMPMLYGPSEGAALFFNGTEGGTSLANVGVLGQSCAVRMLVGTILPPGPPTVLYLERGGS